MTWPRRTMWSNWTASWICSSTQGVSLYALISFPMSTLTTIRHWTEGMSSVSAHTPRKPPIVRYHPMVVLTVIVLGVVASCLALPLLSAGHLVQCYHLHWGSRDYSTCFRSRTWPRRRHYSLPSIWPMSPRNDHATSKI